MIADRAQRTTTVCWQCGVPQPPEGELHFGDCDYHDRSRCVACVDLAEGEHKIVTLEELFR